MIGEVNFPGLAEELRQIVREEVARALEIGGAGGYFNAARAAEYLSRYTEKGEPSTEAIQAMVKRGQLHPIRRTPYMLFTREELDRVATTESEDWVA